VHRDPDTAVQIVVSDDGGGRGVGEELDAVFGRCCGGGDLDDDSTDLVSAWVERPCLRARFCTSR